MKQAWSKQDPDTLKFKSDQVNSNFTKYKKQGQ